MRGTISMQLACGLQVWVVTSSTTSAVVVGSSDTCTGLGAGGICWADTGMLKTARSWPAARASTTARDTREIMNRG